MNMGMSKEPGETAPPAPAGATPAAPPPPAPNAPAIARARPTQPFPPRILPDLLAHTVARWPTRIALDFAGRTWTYGAIDALVRRAARGLQDAGLQPGDRIGLCLPNTPYFVILYFAALRVGAIVVPCNPLYTPAELVHQIRDSGARMLAVPDVGLVHDKVVALAAEAGLEHIIICPMAGILPPAKALGWRWLKRADHPRLAAGALALPFARLVARDVPPAPVAVAPDDIAVLQYTGGTTGVPKGAMLTHANLAANSAQMVAHGNETGEVQQRTLGVLPMFHVFALTSVLNFGIDTGAEIVLLPRFEMAEVLAALKRKPPTQFFGVPTIYVAFNHLPPAKMPDLRALRACVSGGAPLPQDVRASFERLTGGKVMEGYGLTEAAPIIACNLLEGPGKPGSCGPAFPGTTLEIRDPDDPHRLLAIGEKGEVCARGPQVMKGYWQRPEDSANCFVDGALRTGDIGYLDADGYLFLVDRIKDVILCGGYNVYPRVIEEAAYAHPAIGEAVAIGIPDAYRGQSPKLFVTLRPGAEATTEEIATFLAQKLNKIELPRAIEIRAALPKTQIGKIARKDLVAEEAAHRAKQHETAAKTAPKAGQKAGGSA